MHEVQTHKFGQNSHTYEIKKKIDSTSQTLGNSIEVDWGGLAPVLWMTI